MPKHLDQLVLSRARNEDASQTLQVVLHATSSGVPDPAIRFSNAYLSLNGGPDQRVETHTVWLVDADEMIALATGLLQAAEAIRKATERTNRKPFTARPGRRVAV